MARFPPRLGPGSLFGGKVAFSLAKRWASMSSAGGAEYRFMFSLDCSAPAARWYSDGLGMRIELPLESSWRPRGGLLAATLLYRLSWRICCLISSIVPCFIRTACSILSVSLSHVCPSRVPAM